jgi:hypothetical protein
MTASLDFVGRLHIFEEHEVVSPNALAQHIEKLKIKTWFNDELREIYFDHIPKTEPV